MTRAEVDRLWAVGDGLRRELAAAQQDAADAATEAALEEGARTKEIEMLKKALAKAEKIFEEQKAALQDASDAAAETMAEGSAQACLWQHVCTYVYTPAYVHVCTHVYTHVHTHDGLGV